MSRWSGQSLGYSSDSFISILTSVCWTRSVPPFVLGLYELVVLFIIEKRSSSLLTSIFKNSFPASLNREPGGPNVQISVFKCLTISSADLVLSGNAHANLVNDSTTVSMA